PADAARLADRAFGLEDRVATALEWAERPDRTPLVDTLVADATERVERLQPRQIVRRILPREAHFLPLPLVVALALTLAPALPLPSPRLPDFMGSSQEEEKDTRTGSGLLEERSKMEALEGGQTDRAMEAMQKALDKMRAQEEAQRSGKGLRGGRDSERGGASRDRRGGEGGGEGEDFGEGEGLLPGKGRSASPKGEASRRLSATPYDV